MARDLGERARRRSAQRRRRLMVTGAAAGVIVVVGGVVGAVALGGDGEDSTKRISQPLGTSTSVLPTSSTSTTTTVVPRSTDPVVALAQQYDGAYEGAFQNTSSGTNGTVTLGLRIDPHEGTLDVTSKLSGDVFGDGDATARTIRARVTLGAADTPVVTKTKAFGDVTGRVDQSLRLMLSATDVPGPAVKGFELNGGLRADRSGFDATYTVTFEDGRRAQGTITVTCAELGQRASEVPTLCAPPF